ncbi:TPA: hypothetical protein RKT71_002290 [Citrobacter freundii]|nr:hypothetical protein [Citrobacter freundii]
MTALNKQALREAAEKAKDNFMPNFMVPTLDVLALLDELEAVQKTSAARLEAIDRTHKMFQRERDRAENAENRIAELEARKVTVKLPADYRNSDGSINDDMFNTCAVVGAFRDALTAAGIGVKGE